MSTRAVNRGAQRYRGACHCGAVSFEFLGPPSLDVLDCNCSICAASGYLHVTVPHADFRLLSDPTVLSEYRFGSGQACHLFCRHCGIKSFYQPRSHPDCYSVNLRCLEDWPQIPVRISRFDGRRWEAANARL